MVTPYRYRAVRDSFTTTVPRFLMIDQPTQAFYPSDIAKKNAGAVNDADREAVLAMFTAMREVIDLLAVRACRSL
ncbi:DUF3732 domain-containing protein [Mycobacterium sp. PDNC021]|uniref:DUF3732 domain-containing protein n=1 Tax=Mycobacterium sp. PDNC021 TaxID=3391399 RepID=UPI003AABDBC0